MYNAAANLGGEPLLDFCNGAHRTAQSEETLDVPDDTIMTSPAEITIEGVIDVAEYDDVTEPTTPTGESADQRD